jgi:hypothetical protein
MLPAGVDSKGYFVVSSRDGSPLPQIVAKTYNVDDFGGTYGQNLKVYGTSDLIPAGAPGFITGVSNSADPTVGFRTNVAVLNTSETTTAAVDITILDTAGQVAGLIHYLTIPPKTMFQSNVFEFAGLGSVDIDGTVKIRVLSGDPVAAYASQIDNRTQDPILIPAVLAK